jgi:hypothetical protein
MIRLLITTALLVLSTLGWSGASNAQASTYRVELVAFPSLGPNAPVADGWFSCFVQLANPSDTAMSGIVELVTDSPRRNVSHARFFLPPRGRASLELPAHSSGGLPPSLLARALDDEGRLLDEQSLSDLRVHQPLLFDLNVPSRVAPVLRGRALPVVGAHPRDGGPLLTVQSPPINVSTGDLMLPGSAAGYASVTVLLARSATLAQISGSELEALTSWVLAGGALAVVVTRPEDLVGPLLKALVAGEIERTPPSAALVGETRLLTPAETTGSPSPETAGQLAGYAGGNLRQSRWGAAASYGLGEVHLLAFDVARERIANDEWVQKKLFDLMAHAWQRRIVIALPHAQSDLETAGAGEIRRQLDPREGMRWPLLVAALLLLIYALAAGLSRFRDAKRGFLNPWLYPVWAILGFAAIVVLGFVAKGILGSARRVTLVEAGAGMSRATATRFRGFFTRAPDTLAVRGSDRSSVLDVAGDDASVDRRLLVGRDASLLEQLQAKPWQPLVVREDGFIALEGGVSVVPAPGGDIAITNRLTRDLLGVVIKPPDKAAVLVKRLSGGQTLLASQGHTLASPIGLAKRKGWPGLHELGAKGFAEELDRLADGLGTSWHAFETLAPDVDWWPNDVPVLIAEIDGGEGYEADAGLRVESERVLLRVIGWGGAG